MRSLPIGQLRQRQQLRSPRNPAITKTQGFLFFSTAITVTSRSLVWRIRLH
jgi:hypothetical protein